MNALHLGNSITSDALDIAKLFSVAGRVAVVTGGGTGLGLITAKTLAQNGVRVYISGRRADVLEKAAQDAKPSNGQGDVIAVQADASTKDGIRKLRDFVASKEKHINMLINNHGVSEPHGMIDECEQTPEGLSNEMFEVEKMETWHSTHQINTASYHFLSFAFLPLLCAAKSVSGFHEPGNIVNVSSISGICKTSQRGQFNYNSGKAATLALSNILAYELAHRNLAVRVNTILPGYFPTGMTPVTPGDQEGDAKATFMKEWGVPLGRAGNAVDYARTILSVVTNEYMTGAELVVDGGWMLERAF